MVASYIAQMAPSGRIVITAALQAADEMRRVQRMFAGKGEPQGAEP
jgi:hypothetical protein